MKNAGRETMPYFRKSLSACQYYPPDENKLTLCA